MGARNDSIEDEEEDEDDIVQRMSTNPGQTEAKGLAVVTPALLGPDSFERTAAIMNALGPPDIEKLKGVLSKHWLVAALPGAMSSNR